MKALSIRQPWAWLICEGFKPIENRTWQTEFRGRIWIHAAKGMTEKEYTEAVTFARKIDQTANIPAFDRLKRGGIVGQVDIIGCVNYSTNDWFVGPWGLVLKNPYPVPFIPCAGQLGLFEPDLSDTTLQPV